MDEQSEPSPAFPEKLPEVLHSSNDDALEETSIMSERISEEVSTSEEKAGLSSIPGSSAAETLQALTDKALRFLSEASNETIGACLVGLGAATYIVLGRVGLILIGVVGGVVLHATWDPESAGTADAAAKEKEAKRKRELGLAVANRLLQWRDEKSYDSKEEQDKNFNSQLYAGQKLDYSGFASDVAAALDTFTDAVIRDYVKYGLFTCHCSLHVLIETQMVVFTRSSRRRVFSFSMSPDTDRLCPVHEQSPLAKAACRCLFRLHHQFLIHCDCIPK